MTKYSITEDENFPWVSVMRIDTDDSIDISDSNFNITIKDQLEYFVADHVVDGSTFELEELFKKDTIPTLEISNEATVYERIPCLDCGGKGYTTCTVCDGLGYYYKTLSIFKKMCPACGDSIQQGSGKVTCETCGGTGEASTMCDNRPLFTEVHRSNVSSYNNSDYASLIKNGVQFWLDGANRKTMYVRFVPKGRSTSNPTGYVVWNPIREDYVSAGYVGFTVANFNISLNASESLRFDSFLLPKVVMGNPEPSADYKPIDSYVETPGHILSGSIRTDYDWNGDGGGLDNLYVNYTTEDLSGNSAFIYVQEQTNGTEYTTNSYTAKPEYVQTKYIVKSSAYLSDYLVDGVTDDLYESTSDEIVSAYRGVDFTTSGVKSYLYDECTQNEIELPFTMEKTKIPGFEFLSADGECVSADLYRYEIVQSIESALCSGGVNGNQVRLQVEI